MNAVIREWIDKAEGDFGTARRELNASKNPNYDAACFHCQQCVEKLMKGLLISLGVEFPKTHNLNELHRLLAPVCTAWQADETELQTLSRLSVLCRYPGEWATKPQAQEAVRICTQLRLQALTLLNLRLD